MRFITLLALLAFTFTYSSSGQVEKGTSQRIEVDIHPKKTTPAKILTEANFQDSRDDNQLDLEDESEVSISVSNQGGKPATNLVVSIRSSTSAQGIRVKDKPLVAEQSIQVAQFSEVVPGSNERITVPISSSSTLPKQDVQLSISVHEAAGGKVTSSTQITIPISSDPTGPVVDSKIPRTNMQRSDDIAVVIGNKEYENSDIPDVEYAVRDAQIMKRYLVRTLGFRAENIIYVENAQGADLTRIFGTANDPKGQLYNWVKPNESGVFVYYSGHGAPNPESGDAYFVPSNTNPSYLTQNGYPVNQLYENLSTIPAQSMTIVVEACFSGVSEGGSVVQDVSPAVLSVESPIVNMENGVVFTAGAADQVSTWYNEKKHGVFTYYFLKGVRGAADINGNQEVTAGEMESYLTDKVPYRARRMHNREQTPQVLGQNKHRVLVRYDNSPPAQSRAAARLPATTVPVERSVREALSLPSGARKVSEVGEARTVQSGDVIIAVDGSKLTEDRILEKILARHTPGEKLRLEILREGESQTISVTLTSNQ